MKLTSAEAKTVKAIKVMKIFILICFRTSNVKSPKSIAEGFTDFWVFIPYLRCSAQIFCNVVECYKIPLH